MKILVTGSKGQLGNEIASMASQFPTYEFTYTDIDELDITNESDVRTYVKINQPDVILNCAAYTAVDKAESDSSLAYLVNETAPHNLALASADVNALLVHISTDYVFDGKGYLPYSETDVPTPLSVYGKSKLKGEERIFEVAKKGIIIRTAWLYSAFGNNFVKTMMKYGRERGQLRVVFDQVGTPTYAKDLAHTILSILPKAYERSGVELFHYSNEGVASWYDFATLIIRESKIECQVLPILSGEYPTPAPRPFYSVLNKEKLKNTYGIKIPYWSDSVKECIERLNQ